MRVRVRVGVRVRVRVNLGSAPPDARIVRRTLALVFAPG